MFFVRVYDVMKSTSNDESIGRTFEFQTLKYTERKKYL